MSSGTTRDDSRARIWVMRDEVAEGPLACALRCSGLEPVHEPVVERRCTGDLSPALAQLGDRDWLVLTSLFAIERLPEAPVRSRVAVVGEASRRAAEARGLRVGIVSPDGTGEGMWNVLREWAAGARVILYPRSSRAEAPAEVGGVRVESPVFYETVSRAFDASRVADVAAAAVTSPSTAEPLGAMRERPRCASIGLTTSSSLRAMGIEPWIESPQPMFEAMAEAIARGLDGGWRDRERGPPVDG